MELHRSIQRQPRLQSGYHRDVLFRLEARYFGSPGQLYPLHDGTTTNKDLWLTAGITARFR